MITKKVKMIKDEIDFIINNLAFIEHIEVDPIIDKLKLIHPLLDESIKEWEVFRRKLGTWNPSGE